MENKESRGVATWRVDAVVAVLLLIMGVVFMWDSHRLGAGWGSDGPQAGYFPFYVSLLIVVSSLITFYQAVFNGKRDESTFVDGESFRQVLMVLVPSAIYVAAIYWLGIYVSSAIFIGLFMRFLGKYSMAMIAPIALGVSLFFFFAFEMWFKVALPKGPLEAALGY